MIISSLLLHKYNIQLYSSRQNLQNVIHTKFLSFEVHEFYLHAISAW